MSKINHWFKTVIILFADRIVVVECPRQTTLMEHWNPFAKSPHSITTSQGQPINSYVTMANIFLSVEVALLIHHRTIKSQMTTGYIFKTAMLLLHRTFSLGETRSKVNLTHHWFSNDQQQITCSPRKIMFLFIFPQMQSTQCILSIIITFITTYHQQIKTDQIPFHHILLLSILPHVSKTLQAWHHRQLPRQITL